VAARATPFGGLIASGWQTAAVGMRLMCDGYLKEASALGWSRRKSRRDRALCRPCRADDVVWIGRQTETPLERRP